LLTCSFIAGALGNTSTLIFFSFASRYPPFLTTALSCGYGLSGVISSGLAMAQDPSEAHFSVQVFMIITIAVVCATVLSFFIVAHTRFGEELQVGSLQDEPFMVTPEEDKPLSAAWINVANMFWVSMITFYVPGMIPFMVSTANDITYLNSIFLVAPPIGAILAGVYKFYRITVLSFIQTALFALLLVPALSSTNRMLVLHDSWPMYIYMTLFGLLSGYNTTMAYLRTRRDFNTNPMDVEKVCRWVAFASQLGAMAGIFANDGIIHSNLYNQAAS